MDNSEAEIYITKGHAARRQLDAAIRMYLMREDELAIHTVGAAAFRILRDLKQQRGRGELADAMSYGLFALADDLVKGKIERLPDELDIPELRGIVTEIAAAIRIGQVTSAADIPVKFSAAYEGRHWGQFNLPANFLKHADKDGEDFISESILENQELLIKACVSYKTLFGDWTPEMWAFGRLWNAECNDDPAFVPDELCETLRESNSDARRVLCLELIRNMKTDSSCQP